MPVNSLSQDHLALLYRLSQTFNSSLDLSEVLNSVIDEVILSMHAERGFVVLHTESEQLDFRVARGIDHATIADPQFQVSRSIVERVVHEGKPVLSSDAQTDTRFSMRQSVMMLGLRSLLCVPLTLKGRIFGAIYVDNRMQAGIFTEPDLDLLTAIASNAAIAIENARLYQEAVEKGRLEQELRLAHQVQTSMLPTQAPQIAGWEFAAAWEPARQVAGDYYDFIRYRDGDLGLVIADVSDKGMPAALFMAMTRSIIRASLLNTSTPKEAIRQANQLLAEESTNGMFVTLFYARLTPSSGELTFVNAGHNPPILYRPGSPDRMDFLQRTGMALGIDPDIPYEEITRKIMPGEFILFYTDGIPEAQDAAGHFYGMERLQSMLEESCERSASEIVSSLDRSLRTFTNQSAPYDDITVILARRLTTQSE